MFSHILIPVDGSECAAEAFDVGVELAKKLGARVSALVVVDTVRAASSMTFAMGEVVQAYFDALQAEADHVLKTATQAAAAAGLSIDTKSIEGYPARVIIDEAKACGADLIVMGSHGRTGLARMFIGSVAESVVRTASAPVMIVRAKQA